MDCYHLYLKCGLCRLLLYLDCFLSFAFQVTHMSDLIRTHGNLMKHSAQAIEHVHAHNKYYRRHMGRAVTACKDALQAHVGKLMLRWLGFLTSEHSKSPEFAKLVRKFANT